MVKVDFWRSTAAFTALLAIALSSGTASAQEDITPMPAPAQDYTAMSLQQLGELLGNLGNLDDCTEAVPILAEAISRRPDIEALYPARDSAQTNCAVDRRDYAAALGYFRAWEESGEPFPSYGLFIAAMAEDGLDSVRRLEAILLSANAEAISALVPDAVFAAMRTARAEGLDSEVDRIAAWAIQDGVLHHLDETMHSGLASSALSVAVAEENLEFTSELLGHINAPTAYVRLLASREFAPIWPAIEERVGNNLDNVTSAYNASTLDAWTGDPENPELLNDYAHAMYWHGDFAGVVETVSDATGRDDLAETMTEDEAWALNLAAYSLDALGRPEEADAIFDMIGVSPEGEDHAEAWRVSFTINRGSRLVGQGRWEKGLEAAEYAGVMAEESGTPFARSLTLRDQICALNGLGRADETDALLERLRVEAEDFPQLLVPGLLCLGREDEAVDLLIARLENEDSRNGMIVDLQPEGFEMFYTRSILPHPRDLVDAHPELRDALMRYARIIPDAFIPAASLAR